ncbi:protein of unknown function [Aminobacter niigataensis]|nr:protein of unknown function [Aminobacter niigataensis]
MQQLEERIQIHIPNLSNPVFRQRQQLFHPSLVAAPANSAGAVSALCRHGSLNVSAVTTADAEATPMPA